LKKVKKNATQLLKDHKNIDGIFINTDLVAITELIKQGAKIPKDISVVGFSNWFMTSIISPSLNAINQPGLEMGKNSFKLYYKEIKERKRKRLTIKN
jgi:LacI family transcriptional regulator